MQKEINRFRYISLLLFFVVYGSGNAIAQQVVIGTVTDVSTGTVLPGVNILVVGTNYGTVTDSSGYYKLNVPSLQDTVRFSFIGYQKKTVPINGRGVINITLKSTIFSGQQLVVTAYGAKQKSQDVVGAVTSLNEHQLNILKTAPSANLTTSLAGRIPGIIAFQRTGEPGANNAQFFIRGVTTNGYSKSPLILIDGVKSTTTELAYLNPNDISDFSILKDATATSLYGSEAANGVLLIKTKTGYQGPLRVDLRVANTISMPTQVPKFADPVTYMKEVNATTLSRNPLTPLPYSPRKIDKTAAGANPYLYPAVNWRNELFKDYTMNRRYDLHVSGGGDVALYYVSGSFNRSNGLLKVPKLNNFNNNIDLKTYSLRSNINVNLTNSTELEMKISGLFDDYQGPLHGGKSVYHEAVNANPVRFPATFPVDSAHAYLEHPLFGGDLTGHSSNPYAEMVKGYRHYKKSTINAQFGIRQNIPSIEGLKIRALVNVQRYSYSSNTRAYKPYFYKAIPGKIGSSSYNLMPLNPEGGTNYLDYTPGDRTVTSRLYVQAQTNYSRTFGKKQGLDGLFVFTARNQTYDNVNSLQASLPHRNVNLAGRLTYNYNHIYYAEFNFGANASERFAKNHRWGIFPSVGVAWNISNQKFWEPIQSAITRFKVRVTYGFSGNDKIGASDHRFLYLSKVDLNDATYGFRTGINANHFHNGVHISAYSNPSITWERAKKINFGINLGLFHQVKVKANLYYQDRTNIFQQRVGLPASLGLAETPYANMGEVKNRGFSVRLTYHADLNKNWLLAVRGNLTFARNKLVKYSEPNYPTAPNRLRVGYPVDEFFGLYAERLFIDQGDVDNAPPQEFGPYGPGDIKFRDVNGDGIVSYLDEVPLGYPKSPEMNYGFGFSLGFKDFDFSAFFEGLARESFWINTTSGTSINNQGVGPYLNGHQLLKAFADNHWTTKNRNIYALYPHFSTDKLRDGGHNNDRGSTWWMRNGAFLRIKEVQIGYSLPEGVINKLSLRKLRIYVNSRNLAHFSAFKLWDPEMAGNGMGYPLQRTFNIGINIKF